MKLKIKDWQKFQHYKSKNGEKPLWLKIYRSILDDFEFHSMPVESRAILPMLWLIAGDYDGNLPDIAKIAFRLRQSPNEIGKAMKPLIDNGFLEYIENLDLFYTDSIPEHIEKKEDIEKKERTEQKESRTKIEKSTLTFEGAEYLPEDLFILIFNIYPNISPRGNKPKAREKFLKLIKQGENHEAIIRGVRTYSEFCKKSEQFNQHFITWLNQRGWEGEWEGGEHNKPKASSLDKKAAAGAKALESIRRDIAANRDALWNQGDSLGRSLQRTIIPARNNEALAGRSDGDNDSSDEGGNGAGDPE